MKENTNHIGLTDEEVRKSRAEHGVNLLTPPKRPSLFKLYLEKFQDPVVKVLLVAALFSLIISIVENEYAETIGIIAAILLATGIGFFFEYDANKKFDLLNAVNEETLVKVIRNGHVQEVPRKDVVVGDVVLLETGEEIPADGELLESVSLQVNESNLTIDRSVTIDGGKAGGISGSVALAAKGTIKNCNLSGASVSLAEGGADSALTHNYWNNFSPKATNADRDQLYPFYKDAVMTILVSDPAVEVDAAIKEADALFDRSDDLISLRDIRDKMEDQKVQTFLRGHREDFKTILDQLYAAADPDALAAYLEDISAAQAAFCFALFFYVIKFMLSNVSTRYSSTISLISISSFLTAL